MKTLRIYVIIGFLNALIGFFISFYLLSKNLTSPVKHTVDLPTKSFQMYRLLTNGEVEIHFMNIIIAAVLLAIPITLIVLWLSRLIKGYFTKRGRV